MFEPKPLCPCDIQRCMDTISTNTFYMMVASALLQKQELSVVRMGDGEKLLMDMCEGLPRTEGDRHIDDPDWMERIGCLGIDPKVLYRRLIAAASECTWFAPSISGILRSDFSLHDRFPRRDRYVDNFWCNAWDEEMKVGLFKLAGHVLFIHRNLASADALQIRAKYGLGVKVTYLNLSRWEQSDDVIQKASSIDAPLVLFSGGPASKYIGPRIASGGNIPKVTLDIGNAADYWLLASLKDAAQGRR